MTRSVRRLLSATAVLLGPILLAPWAHAQAVPTATGPGGRLALGIAPSGFQADYGKRYIGGAAVYVDANLTLHLGIEAEARRLQYNEEAGIRQTTYLAGPRLTLRPHDFSPYAKLLVGIGQFHFPYGYADGRYFVIAPGAGIDYRLRGSGIKLRLIDFEYQDWPQFTYGQLHPYGLSAGVSLCLWHSETYRPD